MGLVIAQCCINPLFVPNKFRRGRALQLGLLGEEEPHVVQNIPSPRDELGPLLDKPVGTHRPRVVNAARNGVNRTSLLAGLVGTDQRSAALACFDHKDPKRTPADDAVAHGEGLSVGWDTHRKLAHNCARGGNLLGKSLVFWWINLKESTAEHRDRAALGGERRLVRRGIHPSR